MTREVKVYQLRLIEDEPFYTRLAMWLKAVWYKLKRKEGKIWNGKKW